MFSETFVNVFFTVMGLVMVLGMIWIKGINKETARLQKENSDRALAHKNLA